MLTTAVQRKSGCKSYDANMAKLGYSISGNSWDLFGKSLNVDSKHGSLRRTTANVHALTYFVCLTTGCYSAHGKLLQLA